MTQSVFVIRSPLPYSLSYCTSISESNSELDLLPSTLFEPLTQTPYSVLLFPYDSLSHFSLTSASASSVMTRTSGLDFYILAVAGRSRPNTTVSTAETESKLRARLRWTVVHWLPSSFLGVWCSDSRREKRVNLGCTLAFQLTIKGSTFRSESELGYITVAATSLCRNWS